MNKQGNDLIQKHSLNYEESVALRDKMGNTLQSKECYANIFHSIMYSGGKFTSGDWKVAYGYIQVMEGTPLMARHCFIVNSQGEAIDPTLMNISGFKEGEDRGHVSFSVFEDLETYLETVSENDNVPDLIQHFKKIEAKKCQPWAQENNILIIG